MCFRQTVLSKLETNHSHHCYSKKNFDILIDNGELYGDLYEAHALIVSARANILYERADVVLYT